MYNKIEFLNELFKMNQCRIQLLDFLVAEKCIDDNDKQQLLAEHHLIHSSRIVEMLEKAIREETLQSVEYTWSILPHHVVKVNVIGNNEALELVGIK